MYFPSERKAEVRALVWERAADLVPHRHVAHVSVFILAGGTDAEVRLVRRLFAFPPDVTAYDLEPSALRAVRAAGVVKAYCRDVRNMPSAFDYDVVNYDGWAVLGAALRDRVLVAASHARHALGVSLTLGHHPFPRALKRVPVAAVAAWAAVPRSRVEALAALLPGWHLHVAIYYRGCNGKPILTTLWGRVPAHPPIVRILGFKRHAHTL
jgi:hypothetical protein